MDTSETDIEALRLARDEARRKLDHEIRLVYETDDTALRTVRTSVVIIGILVSAAGIAGPDSIRAIPPIPLALSLLGSVSLLVSVFTGFGSLTASDFAFGIASGAVVHPVHTGASERRYLEELLISYQVWVTRMYEVREGNSGRLLIVLGSFFLGVLGIGAAGGIMIVTNVV